MTKTKLYITFLFVTTLIGSCSKETNCDDVNCYPCPSYPSPYTLIAFENEGDSAFSQIDLDSNLIVFYTKNATDTFLPSKYTGTLYY